MQTAVREVEEETHRELPLADTQGLLKGAKALW